MSPNPATSPALVAIAAGVVFGIADFLLRPIGGAIHAAWAMRISLAWLHEVVSAF